jgi:PAS domain S-box-containing protein
MSLQDALVANGGGTRPPSIPDALSLAMASWDGMIEMLPVGIYICDLEGRVIRHNRQAIDLWGRFPDPADRFGGAHRLFWPDGRPLQPEAGPMAEVLATGEPVRDGEIAIERPDGSRIAALVNIEPLRDQAGRLVGAVSCFQDITARRESERRLAARECELQTVLDALPAAIYTTDAEGRITFYNQAAATMAGRRPALGEDSWCVTWKLYNTDGTPLPHDQCPMALALKENRPIRDAEAVAERPDGARVPFIPYPTPLRDKSGNPIGAVNMLVDISERKQAESRQRMLLRELNHRVKNNLQMLSALFSAAQRDTDSAEARAVLADANQRLAAMAAAHQVLYEAEQSRFNGRDFLAAVCATVDRAAGDAVQISFAAEPCELSNDTVMPLALILNELLTNAIKYGARQGRIAQVRVALARAGQDFLLTVEDDGPGFDFAAARRRSSGLGLVIGLARQLGGDLRVERASGARCIVRFLDRGAAQAA